MGEMYDVTNLPPGFRATRRFDSDASICRESYVIQTADATSEPICTDSPTFQADVDAFVAAHLADGG